MAEEKNKQAPQPIKESVVEKARLTYDNAIRESNKSSNVSSTLKAPDNPSKNGGKK
ncbi:MAG: hypothetical protein HOP21_01415 [Methylotenera sp.]|nr:hypothetical protein [Methylotenera sp.]